jgi:hypothetical protein
MGFLIFFLVLLAAGIFGYIKYLPFHDFVSRILTPRTGVVSVRRIESLNKILEDEKKKTAELQAKAEKAETDRQAAKAAEDAILEERKKQKEASLKIKG